MKLKTIHHIGTSGKKVFLRADLNAPLDSQKHITDKSRLEAILPTIRFLLENNAKILVTSHLGQPKNGYDATFSLFPILNELENLLGKKIGFLAFDGEILKIPEKIFDVFDVVLAENLRFYEGEKRNDAHFLQEATDWADIYINDAFGVCHRKHASVNAIVDKFLSQGKEIGGGLLLEKEYTYLHETISEPKRPFIAILGGSKVSSKLGAIEKLLEKADTIILGGAMVFTFLKAQNIQIGKSLFEEELIETAKNILQKAESENKKILLPKDFVVSPQFGDEKNTQIVDVDKIPADMMALDIGPKSIEFFKNSCLEAKTIFWNGPMGAYEIPTFANGSIGIAKIISESHAITFAGGGDSLAIIKSSGFESGFDFLSTGGGASLELIEGKTLPGMEKLFN